MSTTLIEKPNRSDIDLAIKAMIDNATDAESLVELDGWISSFAAMARQWKQLLAERFVEHIKATGEIQCGTKRWYVGTDKKVKARDDVATAEAIFDAASGDLQRLCGCLSANAWKHGTVRRLLQELLGDEPGQARYNELFETTEVEDVKTGKPKEGLKCIDDRFIP